MRFCEDCGKRIPDGMSFCADCAQKKSAPPVQRKQGGTWAVVLMTVLIVAFLAFAVVAWLFGGKSAASDGAGQTLTAWDGESTAATADSDGPESLEATAPDVDAVLANTEPEDPTAGHTYQIVISDVTWDEAKALAEEAGGYLATITSQAEYEAICEKANQAAVIADVRYLWLGASEGSNGWSGTDCWITGEEWSFENWYPGEPSGADEDGTPETVLCLWSVADTGWTFNDQRNDLLSVLPSASGKIGYVIEFEG